MPHPRGAKEARSADGMKLDKKGNVFANRTRRRVRVFTPDGKHLGTINTGEPTANLQLGRGWVRPLHHGQSLPLPHQDQTRRAEYISPWFGGGWPSSLELAALRDFLAALVWPG